MHAPPIPEQRTSVDSIASFDSFVCLTNMHPRDRRDSHRIRAILLFVTGSNPYPRHWYSRNKIKVMKLEELLLVPLLFFTVHTVYETHGDDSCCVFHARVTHYATSRGNLSRFRLKPSETFLINFIHMYHKSWYIFIAITWK